MTSKERCIAVLEGRKPDRTPVFPLLMGYAAKKAGLSYRQFASDGRYMAQAQLNIIKCFDIDAITACSDAFRISADLGGEIVFHDNTPPHIRQPIIQSRSDLKSLGKIDVTRKGSRCADRILGVSEMVRAAGHSHYVLGWVDFPFAEACSCCGVQQFMFMMMDEPELAHEILGFLTDIVIDFALAQLEQGAPMIGCGDAAASLVSPDMFREFALPYEKRVVEAIRARGGLVKTHICGNTSAILEDIASNGADLYNVDHLVDLGKAACVYNGASRALKGNIDPVSDMLSVSPEHTYAAVRKCIELAGGCKYFLSPGCEVPLGIDDENMKAFCSAVR